MSSVFVAGCSMACCSEGSLLLGCTKKLNKVPKSIAVSVDMPWCIYTSSPLWRRSHISPHWFDTTRCKGWASQSLFTSIITSVCSELFLFLYKTQMTQLAHVYKMIHKQGSGSTVCNLISIHTCRHTEHLRYVAARELICILNPKCFYCHRTNLFLL